MSEIPVQRARSGKGRSGVRRPGSVKSSHTAANLRRWALRGSRMLAVAGLLAALPGARAQAVSLGSQFVGSISGGQNISVRAQVAGTVSTVEVLTLGVSGLDFAHGIGAKTCGRATLAVGATCIESVTFTPRYPGPRVGAVVLLDRDSNVLGAAYLSGTGLGGLGVLVAGNILPVAGNGISTGSVLDGDNGTSASLCMPTGVTADGAGNLYIADRGHNRIRKISVATGAISTLAGNGTAAYAGDGLSSTDGAVSVNAPWGLALDGAGNLYVADTGNNVVRRIAAASGLITTVAGTGQQGSSGDGQAATAATLNQPQGVSVDSGGNLYIADTSSNRIRRVDAVTGIIDTVAGAGHGDAMTGAGGYTGDGGPATNAALNFPLAVAFDPSGNMYIPDSANNVVRKVAAVNGVITAESIITTFAGTGSSGYTGDGGLATSATLSSPSGVIADAAGNVYIADTLNASIRKVSSATGFIRTIARNDAGEYVDNEGGPYAIGIDAPIGLFLDGSGDLYFADSLSHRIREMQSNFGIVDFTSTPVRQGDQSAPQSLTIENDGSAPLELNATTYGKNTALDWTTTTCDPGSQALAVNEKCVVAVIFAPSLAGDPLLGNVDIAGNTVNSFEVVNSPLNIELIGDATPANSTSTTLASSANPSGFGQGVTFTATVSAAGNPAGSVTFMEGANPLGTAAAVNSSGVAALQTATLAVGVHTITASYGGDSVHLSSTSSALSQTVLEGTSTTLASSANPSAPGKTITFTATVTPCGGGGVAPDGSVTLSDGDASLSTVPLGAGGVATYSTATLQNGSHAIRATYNGDAARQISVSVSNMVGQEVLVASQVAVTSTPNPSNFGSPVTFTATASSSGSAVPTGAVSILDGGTEIGAANLAGSTGAGAFTTSSLAVGPHTITAAYLGDLNNTASASAPMTQVVSQVVIHAQTATALTAAPNPVLAGATVQLTATVQPVHGGATPSGTVAFTDTLNGATVSLGSAVLGTAGMAAVNPTLALGLHFIVATYGGDGGNAGSASAAVAVTVHLATSSIVLASSSDPSVAASAVTFTATVTGGGGEPTGIVVFFADGTSLGSATLGANGVATLSDASLTPGTHSTTASYAGDASHAASTSLAVSQVVDTIPTMTALTASTGGAVSLAATVAGNNGPTPTGTVTFTNGTTSLGSAFLNSGGVATFSPNLAAGTYMLVASYGGDALHSPSTSGAVSTSEAASAFNLTVTPSTVTMAANQSATTIVTLAATGNFSDTIALACASLPTGATCQFSSASVSLAVGSTENTRLTISTGDMVAGPTSGKVPGSADRRTNLAGLFLPLSVCFGCLFCRLGNRRGKLHTAAFLLLGGAFLLASGCTYIHLNKRTFSIQVTGTGVNSNTMQSQNVTISLTQ